jgi:type II secretory ATPase GspE/PulE/Tfp pilus assembly ATPase PilB-like protein
MIGEIRDTETLDIAVKAALTGHLVLSSLHTTTAPGSVIRMMNMGIQPYLLCSAVLAIVGQRLLRRVCSKCKEQITVPDEAIKRLKIDKMKNIAKVQFFKGKGCKQCLNTGYAGRVGINEVLILTPKVKTSILQREGEMRIKQVGRKDGMQTMREDGLEKAFAGLTTLEEVLRVTAPDEEEELESSRKS